MHAAERVRATIGPVRVASDRLIASLGLLARSESIPVAHERLTAVHAHLVALDAAAAGVADDLGIDLQHGIPPIIDHEEVPA